jgi:hypothetical protein
MSKQESLGLTRRRVFAGAGGIGALAAAAAALPIAKPVVDTPTASPSETPDADGRYQVTQHVLRYYRTARV